jgi:7-dehydrocholesterol reductase
MPTLASILLMLCAPPFVIVLWYTNVALGGSLLSLWELCSREGLFTTVYAVWRPVMFGTPEAWMMLGAFGGLQLLLMRVVPGRSFHGPVTPRGNIPVYRANGPLAFAITLALYWFGAFHLRLFSPGIVYDHFGGILGALNLSALILCLILYVKGRVAPSSSDTEHSGSPGFDFYRGTELYPRILGWDVKQFTNCRIGMMGWAVIILSFAAKQRELYGLSDSMLVSVALQLIYITKFFCWETGYLRTLDIVHDRAGFYICWGCLVWLPGVYTSTTLYLVNHPRHLGIPLAITILILGATCVMTTYLADLQRQHVRATNGRCRVWGTQPRIIRARYFTETRDPGQSLLLASGFWGISRHFHYLTEILGAFFWSVPALFEHFMPYVYVTFLVILLAHRAIRDDRRCARKYGQDWERYCRLVPYRIVPGLY